MPSFYSGNYYLSLAQMQVNATYIYNYLGSKGWTVNAISGLLGNAQTESTINPGIWQNLKYNRNMGFGLTQWTPAYKYLDWCDGMGYNPSSMDSACERLILESQSGGLQWVVHTDYPLTFAEFVVSEEAPYYLGMTFLHNYEMPKNLNQPKRGEQAEYWYEYLSGEEPPEPPPGPSDRNVYNKGMGILIPLLGRRIYG